MGNSRQAYSDRHTIGLPGKGHSLTGQWWPTFSCLLGKRKTSYMYMYFKNSAPDFGIDVLFAFFQQRYHSFELLLTISLH